MGRAPPFWHVTPDILISSAEMGRALRHASPVRGCPGHVDTSRDPQAGLFLPLASPRGSCEALSALAIALKGAGPGLGAGTPGQRFLRSGLKWRQAGDKLGPGPCRRRERLGGFSGGVDKTGDPREVCTTGDAHGTSRDAGCE